MNKRLALILVIMLTIGGGLAYLVSSPPKVDDNSELSGQTEGVDIGMPLVDTMPGTYIDYSESAIGTSTGVKLLFFHAPWCPQCRDLDVDIKAKGVPSGLSIIKVDYDSNQALRQKYGVTIQTTVVRVDDHGQLVEKFVAYDNPTLGAVIKELL